MHFKKYFIYLNVFFFSSVSNTFAITDNGTIVTKSRLDREFLDFYSFEVTVADTPDTHNQQVSKCIVKITVRILHAKLCQFVEREKNYMNLIEFFLG